MKKLILAAILPLVLNSCSGLGFGFTATIPLTFKSKDGTEITIPITLGKTESEKAPKEVAP